MLGLVFCLGIGVGSVTINNVFADSQPKANSDSQAQPEIAPSPKAEGKSKKDYPQNEAGEAYGSLSDAKSLNDAPDLISAVGVDGTSGYIKFTDMFEESPKTPEEAIKQQKQKIAAGDKFIPLYDKDGKTVIGKFIVKAPNEDDIIYKVKGSDIKK